jgi:hypothetical protein
MHPSTLYSQLEGKSSSQKPVRAAIFSTVGAADQAVSRLAAAGFTNQEISVICSDEAKEAHFREFQHEDPAGAHTGNAALAGGAIGATLGGLAALAGIVATGGIGLAATGAILASAGGLSGTFVGAMLTRGVEKEIADFYDQEVRHGKLLVSVEVHGPEAPARLAEASAILAESGAQPLPLTEG